MVVDTWLRPYMSSLITLFFISLILPLIKLICLGFKVLVGKKWGILLITSNILLTISQGSFWAGLYYSNNIALCRPLFILSCIWSVQKLITYHYIATKFICLMDLQKSRSRYIVQLVPVILSVQFFVQYIYAIWPQFSDDNLELCRFQEPGILLKLFTISDFIASIVALTLLSFKHNIHSIVRFHEFERTSCTLIFYEYVRISSILFIQAFQQIVVLTISNFTLVGMLFNYLEAVTYCLISIDFILIHYTTKEKKDIEVDI